MQPISIFITPTSCAYDILDLPRHAKSPLSPLLTLSLFLSLPVFLFSSLTHLLSLLVFLSRCLPPSNPPPISLGSKAHYLDTLCDFCQSVSLPVSGLEVRVNLPRPMLRGCGIISPGKGHLLSAQKWFCQHIQVPGEPRCNYLILF